MGEKDKEGHREYILRECDLVLINAAIKLGDTLLGMPEITLQNVKAGNCSGHLC